ncbi:MAG: hypothetical protein ACRC7R_03945, partial [Sarcina sp.]
NYNIESQINMKNIHYEKNYIYYKIKHVNVVKVLGFKGGKRYGKVKEVISSCGCYSYDYNSISWLWWR